MSSISGHFSEPFMYLTSITTSPASNCSILCISLEWTQSLMSIDFLFNSGSRNEEGKIKGVISIPRLQAEARSEILTQWSTTKLLLQMDSSATAYGSTISRKVTWRYGMCLYPTRVLPRALCTWVQCWEPLVSGWPDTTDNYFICAFSDEEKIEFEWNTGSNVDTKKVAANFPVDLSGYPKSLHKYANSLLDYRVPQTDKTFRHVGSKLIVVSTNQSVNKYTVISAKYVCNPELGERGDPKMDKACSLPPRIFWGKKKHSCIVAQLYRL